MSDSLTLSDMATDYLTSARRYLGGARQAIEDLEQVRRREHDKREVAQLLDRINQGFKLSELCALVGIGERLELIAERLDDGRLSADEVDAIVNGAA